MEAKKINWAEIIKAHDDELFDAMREAVKKSYKESAPAIVSIFEDGTTHTWIDYSFRSNETGKEIGEHEDVSGRKFFNVVETGCCPEWDIFTDRDSDYVLALFAEKLTPQELEQFKALETELENEACNCTETELADWVRENAPKAYDAVENDIIKDVIDWWSEEAETYDEWIAEALKVASKN